MSQLLRSRRATVSLFSRAGVASSVQSPWRRAPLGRQTPAALPPPQQLRTHQPLRVLSCATTGRWRSSMARQRAEPPQQAPPQLPQRLPPAEPPPQQQQQRGHKLLPICFQSGRVLVGDGVPVLDDVTPLAGARLEGDVLILSLSAEDGPSSMEDFVLGQLRCRRWLCCARNKLFWQTPEWGTSAQELPGETQFLLLELEDGTYAIILPLIDNQAFRGTLRPPSPELGADALMLRLESGSDSVLADHWHDAVLLAGGSDPYVLVEEAVVAAAARSGGARPLREKVLPPNLDVFGWCSWDAFFTSVSASSLSQAVASLAAGATPARWVIIDDGWQCTDLDEPFRNPPVMPPHNNDEAVDSDVLESYWEGEIEVLGMAAKDIPAGTATGSIMQEVVATQSIDAMDYHRLVQQRASAVQQTHQALPAKQRRRQNALYRFGSVVLEYLSGVFVGIFQAMVLTLYQYLVDPAAPGSWPVRLFSYLCNGPCKQQMLQFYAVSTAFTRRLTDVRANSKFSSPDATADDVSSGKPENLRWVVSNLKKKFGVQFVYCWHGLPAYWAGVAPDAPGVAKYGAVIHYGKPTPGLLEVEPSLAWNPATLGGTGVIFDPASIFEDMHSYLERAGVDGVKVDCQAGVGLVGDRTGGGPASALRFHSALEDSVARHFPENAAINCMAHSTENIYRWRDTAVTRVSDDFYPTDRASFRPHLLACSYNSLFLSALALPDWDMFHSRHEAAEQHAAARAVSGGPVYISDQPGHHDHELLKKLVLPDGSILRARLPGRPTRDCIFVDPARDGKSLLKVWNLNACTGIVGVFNLQGASWDRTRRRFYIHNSSPPTLTTTVRVWDVEPFRALLEAVGCEIDTGLAAAQSHAHDAHATHIAAAVAASAAPAAVNGSGGHGHSVQGGHAFGGGAATVAAAAVAAVEGWTGLGADPGSSMPDWAVYVNTTGRLHRVKWSEGVEVTLQAGDAAVVTMAPILVLPSGLQFAPLGFTNMLNGGGGVQSVRVPGGMGAVTAAAAAVGLQHLEATTPLVHSTAAEAAENVDGASSGRAAVLVGERAAAGASGLLGDDVVEVQLRGHGSFLSHCSRRPERCSLQPSTPLEPGSEEGGRVAAEFVYHDGQLVVQVPWVEATEGRQGLVLEFAPRAGA